MRPPKLTRLQQRAAKLLAMGVLKPGAIAQDLGINRSTLWKWLQQPAFRRRVSRYNEIFETWINQHVKSMLELTFRTLREMMKTGNPRVKQFAVETVLRLNNRATTKGDEDIRMTHSGQIGHEHRGIVDLGKIKNKAQKERIKQFLADAQPLVNGHEP